MNVLYDTAPCCIKAISMLGLESRFLDLVQRCRRWKGVGDLLRL
jgi:hypothetical protein